MPVKRIAVAEGAVADLSWIKPVAMRIGCELVFGPVETLDQLQSTTDGCEALVVSLHKIGPEKMNALPKLVKCIGRLGIGLDNIDLVTAAKSRITVIYQPLYAIDEVANHAVAMIMALHRGLFTANEIVHNKNWGAATQVAEIVSLQDTTVGVIGCGRIGQAVIRRLVPFTKHILGYDVLAPDNLDGVEMVSNLDDLLSRSHIVTLHAPYLPSTHHMIDEAQMARMPKGAILVNVSRGGLIDEVALGMALESGHLSGAGLDVFEIEPLPTNSHLRGIKNLIMSPHIAWYSQSSGPRLAEWGLRDVLTFLTKQEIEYGSFATGPFRTS